jgi:uncharacterized protein
MTEKELQNLNSRGKFQNSSIKGSVEETHISWVIVAKSHVFKIKKPLKLSFLDFSTLTQRKKYCYRELKLNQRFSPIYLNVWPVRKRNDRWNIGGHGGEIMDYAVHMKRLISSKRMDKLLKKENVTAKHIRSLATVISSFHSGAKRVSNPFQPVEARNAFNDIDSIRSIAREHIGAEASGLISKSIAWSDAFVKAHARRIQERIENGFCRDVHGDLHSGNIFLYETPILFDCIEFNDRYRQIDLINEIAFFCMDLEAYGRSDLSRLFIKEYQQKLICFETEADQRLMEYYKCFRANVRAKVHALSANQASGDEDTFKMHVQALRKYLQLMKRYMKKLR